jgi:hypothetical protein
MKRYYRFLVSFFVAALLLLGMTSCLTSVSTNATPAPVNSGNKAPAPDVNAVNNQPVGNAQQPNNIVGNDPVSGQSSEVDLRWQDLCQSSEYQVQIAKDPDFTIIVVDTGPFAPASSESPGVYYPAGGRSHSPSSVTGLGNLEPGHTYYWRARVRQAASGQQMVSPWSEVASFTVKSGTRVAGALFGTQPISPVNGQISCPVKSASFSWTPLGETTKYRFMLAKDPAMTQVIADTSVTTTAYTYGGQLEYGQAYFWKVMALDPAPSDWSATFSFQAERAPISAAPPSTAPQTPPWAWVVIVVGLFLLIVIIVLIFRMRHR